MKKRIVKQHAYFAGILVVLAFIAIGLGYVGTLHKGPKVIEYTVNNPNPTCSQTEVTPDGIPPAISDRWQTPCSGGYFYLKPYHAIYYQWNDQAYFITEDTNSFRVYPQDSTHEYGHDRKNVYHQNQSVQGADPTTFVPPVTAS